MSSANATATNRMTSQSQNVPAVAAPTGVTKTEVLVAGLVLAVLSAGLSYVMGRDRNWDYFNYHGYATLDPFGARLGQDFFPAGVQGYLNRLPYLPLALMERAGWHSAVTAAVLAAAQSLNLLFLYLLARHFTAGAPQPLAKAIVVTGLGAATGVYWLQVGSTFVDPLTTPPIMAALWLVLRRPSGRAWFAAGLLAGGSVALKLTNAPFAVGLIAAGLVAGFLEARRVQWPLAVCAGTSAGFLLLYGHWGWRLYELHGSPTFPVFNNVFRSPDFGTSAIAFHRFIPQSLGDIVSFPFAMASHRSWLYSETVAPDIRPAVLVVVVLLWVAAAALRARGSMRPVSAHRAQAPTSGLHILVVFFGLSTLAWLATSSNGRYATPLFLLLGPLIFAASNRLVGVRGASILALVVLILQCFLVYGAGNPRWAPAGWTQTWMPGSVPAHLKQRPELYISVATSSESYFAGHVHPESVFVNPIGLVSLANEGPGWRRFIALRDRFAERTKVLFPMAGNTLDRETLERRVALVDGSIDRLGLTLQRDACDVLAFDDPAAVDRPLIWQLQHARPPVSRKLVVCSAVVKAPDPELAGKRRQVTAVLDALEKKCPAIFSPNGAQVEGNGRVWSRHYGKYDLIVLVSPEGQIYFRMDRQATDVNIGNMSTWKDDLARFECRLPHGGSRGIDTISGDAFR